MEKEEIPGGVVMFGTWEEMGAEMSKQEALAKARTTPGQLALCDGESHFALCIEDPTGDANLVVLRVHSIKEMFDQQWKYLDASYVWGTDDWQLDEAMWLPGRYLGDGGTLSRGYLNVEAWDGVFQIDEPDYHDWHASKLVEITEEEFEAFRAIRQSFIQALSSHTCVDAMNRWVEEANAGVTLLREHLGE